MVSPWNIAEDGLDEQVRTLFAEIISAPGGADDIALTGQCITISYDSRRG